MVTKAFHPIKLSGASGHAHFVIRVSLDPTNRGLLTVRRC